MRRVGHIARIGVTRNAYAILVGRLQQKRLLARHRRRSKILLKCMSEVKDMGFCVQQAHNGKNHVKV